MPKQNQHYVPKMLLRNFTPGETEQIHVYDKSNDNEFRVNINKIASEIGFNDASLEGNSISLEPLLEKLESSTSQIFREIIKKKVLHVLDESQILWLAMFLAVQFMRTKEQRLALEFLSKDLEKKLIGFGATDDDLQRLGVLESHDQAKFNNLMFTLWSALDFVPLFLNKGWMLYESREENPLYISDNPVVLDNHQTFGPYGNLGLDVPGIEIYLPLSTTLCLGLVCPTIDAEFKEGWESLQMLDELKPGFVDTELQFSSETRIILEGYFNKTAIPLDEENVVRLNSLQVVHSSRFVFCERDDFDLVKDMLSKNENLRTGKKPTVN